MASNAVVPITKDLVVEHFSESDILDTVLLYCFLDKFFYSNSHDEVPVVASILLYQLVREPIFRFPVIAAVKVVDAFARLNGRQISLGFITDPMVTRDVQIVKGMFLLDSVWKRMIDISDLKTWMFWHLVDFHGDASGLWDFQRENEDFMKLLQRFPEHKRMV